jgi:Protein of unknown function (DUF2721)
VGLPSNPFAILTFISAPAVLTNASCVLLFGTGNRYGRAIDRMHELADLVEKGEDLAETELHLRVRQLQSSTACGSKRVKILAMPSARYPLRAS